MDRPHWRRKPTESKHSGRQSHATSMDKGREISSRRQPDLRMTQRTAEFDMVPGDSIVSKLHAHADAAAAHLKNKLQKTMFPYLPCVIHTKNLSTSKTGSPTLNFFISFAFFCCGGMILTPRVHDKKITSEHTRTHIQTHKHTDKHPNSQTNEQPNEHTIMKTIHTHKQTHTESNK